MVGIPNSIVDDTKKVLGIASDYTEFDLDIILHINSVFSTLQQLGVGPKTGFSLTDNSTLWTDFLGDNVLANNVKSYMYLRVRLLFDPPATSFGITAVQDQIKELEWRMNTQAEFPANEEEVQTEEFATFFTATPSTPTPPDTFTTYETGS